jgi:hopanoid biosynthesis associated protein HpnK
MLPPEQIPALVDSTGRFGNRMFVDGVRYFGLAPVRRQLKAEIRAQFEAFARTGLALDHVNAHKHFHLHPTLFEMILQIGRDFGLGGREDTRHIGVRIPAEPLWTTRHPVRSRLSALLLTPWLARMKHRLRATGIAHNDHVFGLSDSGRMDERRLLEILARLPPGVSEIYLHPGTLSGSDIASSMKGYRHTDELAALMSPQVRAAMARMTADDLACGGYRDMPRTFGRRHAA